MPWPAVRDRYDEKQADIDFQVAGFGQNLVRIQRELWSALQAHLAEFERIESPRARRILLADTRANVNLAARSFATVQRLLLQEGYIREVDRFVRSYDALARLLGAAFEEMDLGLSFTNKDVDAMTALKSGDVAVFRELGADLSRRIHRNLFQSVMTRRSVGAVTDSIRSLVVGSEEEKGYLERHAATWADTALKAFDRQMTFRAAENAGLEHYVYMGPLDRKTRLFCACHVGLTLSREQVERLDNGQIGPVMTYAGGYRCRHTLAPVRPEVDDRILRSQVSASLAPEDRKAGSRTLRVFITAQPRPLLSKPQQERLAQVDALPGRIRTAIQEELALPA